MFCRKSHRLRGHSPEWNLYRSWTCLFCGRYMVTLSRSTVALQCCKRFVHRKCQKQWEREGRGSCSHCGRHLRRRFSIDEPPRRRIVSRLRAIFEREGEQITDQLKEVSNCAYLVFGERGSDHSERFLF